MAFFGFVLKAGASKDVKAEEDEVVVTISNVAFNGKSGETAKLFATVVEEDGPQKLLLATLKGGAVDQYQLDVTFPQDVTFSVEGAGEIHISGIVAPQEDEDDENAMYGGFSDEDEEIGSDEEMAGSDEEDGEGESDDLESDPRVEELSSEEGPAKKAAPALKLARKAEESNKAGPAKKQKVEIPITSGKAAPAAPKGEEKKEKKEEKKKEEKKADGSAAAVLKCPTCQKSFNNPAGLEQHQTAKHGAGAGAEKKEGGEKHKGQPAPATPKPAAAAKPATPKGTPAPAAAPAKTATPKGAATPAKPKAATPAKK